MPPGAAGAGFRCCGGDLLCPLRQSRQSAAGNAADGLRLRSAPPRPIGPLFPDPFYGGILLIPGGAVPARGNLSGQSQLPPGHRALVRWTVKENGVPLPRLLRRSQRSRVVVVPAPSPLHNLCPTMPKARPQAVEPLCRESHPGSGSGGGGNVNPQPPAPLLRPAMQPNWRPP